MREKVPSKGIKYLRSTALGFKDIGFENQRLWQRLHSFEFIKDRIGSNKKIKC